MNAAWDGIFDAVPAQIGDVLTDLAPALVFVFGIIAAGAAVVLIRKAMR